MNVDHGGAGLGGADGDSAISFGVAGTCLSLPTGTAPVTAQVRIRLSMFPPFLFLWSCFSILLSCATRVHVFVSRASILASSEMLPRPIDGELREALSDLCSAKIDANVR